jgi:putative ABC transport system permease protein
MKFVDILVTANQSLLRNKARSILTIIAIFIGATTLALTNGIGSGITTYLNKQVGNLGNTSTLTVTAASNTESAAASDSGLAKYTSGEKKVSGRVGGVSQTALTQADIAKIQQVKNIVSAQPFLSVTPDYIAATSDSSQKYEFSLEETVGANSTLDMSNGSAVDNNSKVTEISIPSSYVSPLGFSSDANAVGKQVVIGVSDASGNQSTVTATVTGVQQKNLLGSAAAYANNVLFSALYSITTTGLPIHTTDAYGTVTAVMKDGLTDAQVNQVKSDLSAKGYDAKTIKDQVSTVFSVIDAITYVFDGFALITLAAAAFGIVNTLYMSVSERTKEIGLMKALGMAKYKIFLLFSIEAILIGFWGSVLGIGFATIIGSIIDRIATHGFLKDFPGLQLLTFPLSTSALIVGGIMLIAFLAGTLPARRASQKDPIEALRYE